MKQTKFTRTRTFYLPKPDRSWAALVFVLALMLLALTPPVKAQQNLGEIVQEYGFDWMIGQWNTYSDEGDPLQINYEWALNKNLINVSFKVGPYQYQGLIFYKPATEEVVQIGVDNRGSHSHGLWEPDVDKALVTHEFTRSNGEVNKMAISHSKGKNGAMKVQLFAIQESGALADQPWASLEYKRKTTIVGKWRGEYENEWGEKGEYAALITDTGGGKFQIKLQDSFEDWAEIIAVLDAKQDASGGYSFEGDSDNWTGKGSGTVEGSLFKGTFKGNESGKFTMKKLP